MCTCLYWPSSRMDMFDMHYFWMHHLIHTLRACLLINSICLSWNNSCLGIHGDLKPVFSHKNIPLNFMSWHLNLFGSKSTSSNSSWKVIFIDSQGKVLTCNVWVTFELPMQPLVWRIKHDRNIEAHNYANARGCFAQMASFSWAWRYCWILLAHSDGVAPLCFCKVT